MSATHLQTVQSLNRSAVLRFISQHEPVARHQIARDLNLSPTTISTAVAHLMEKSLVRELGHGISSGGRRPVMLGINPDGGIIISVDVSSVLPQRILRAAALNLKGNTLYEVQHERDLKGNEILLEALQVIISKVLAHSGGDLQYVLAIGISVPGLVDSQTGVLVSANIEVRHLHLGEALETAFKVPVLVRNSEDVAALGEYHFGAGREVASLMYLSVGYGVGAGLVVDGKIFPQGRISAGEIGHTTIRSNGPQCHCGNRGRLVLLKATDQYGGVFSGQQENGRHSYWHIHVRDADKLDILSFTTRGNDKAWSDDSNGDISQAACIYNSRLPYYTGFYEGEDFQCL